MPRILYISRLMTSASSFETTCVGSIFSLYSQSGKFSSPISIRSFKHSLYAIVSGDSPYETLRGSLKIRPIFMESLFSSLNSQLCKLVSISFVFPFTISICMISWDLSESSRSFSSDEFRSVN